MKNDQNLMNEIRDANLSYLILAQALLRADRQQAIFQLGICERTADLIAALTPMQLLKVAAGNMLICRMRFDDEIVWSLLTDNGVRPDHVDGNARRLHASILMAGQYSQSVQA
jgi:flagellar transcriptional activator FlhD